MSNILRVGLIITGIFVGLCFLFVGFSFFILAGAISGASSTEDEGVSGSGDKVAIVEVKDVITTSENVIRQLKKYDKNNSVKAIVVRVESPGGSVAASQEMYEQIKEIAKSSKPVVISMGDVAASGGYYLSLGATKIVANPATLTGGISAVLQFPNVHSLLEKIGVNMVTVKSGKLKDAGSPFRDPTPEDKLYFQDLINDVYGQFVRAVSENRNIPEDEVVKFADGRGFTGTKALKLKLVDTLGTYEDAIKIAGKLGGIYGIPKIIKERKKISFWESINIRLFNNPLNKIDELLSEPILEFRFNK